MPENVCHPVRSIVMRRKKTNFPCHRRGRWRVIHSRRLFVFDPINKLRFLIDTGADISVVPRIYYRHQPPDHNSNLSAANGSVIKTYGVKLLNVNLGLRKNFTHQFIVADVSKPIIGVDFLSKFELLVDLNRRTLRDNRTSLEIHATIMNHRTFNSSCFPRRESLHKPLTTISIAYPEPTIWSARKAFRGALHRDNRSFTLLQIQTIRSKSIEGCETWVSTYGWAWNLSSIHLPGSITVTYGAQERYWLEAMWGLSSVERNNNSRQIPDTPHPKLLTSTQRMYDLFKSGSCSSL